MKYRAFSAGVFPFVSTGVFPSGPYSVRGTIQLLPSLALPRSVQLASDLLESAIKLRIWFLLPEASFVVMVGVPCTWSCMKAFSSVRPYGASSAFTTTGGSVWSLKKRTGCPLCKAVMLWVWLQSRFGVLVGHRCTVTCPPPARR